MDVGGPAFLVVEDDDGLQRTLQRLLNQFGGVIAIGTAAEGMAALTSSCAYVGILVDVRLPDGNGVEVLAHARRRARYTGYAALVSGDVTKELVAEAFRFNAQYLVKPFSLDEVYEFALRARSRAPTAQSYSKTE
ncbi:MAG TPA: response regulator [Polyangiaceae bacterium]|jgi:DNA-binding response OmpR family regulator